MATVRWEGGATPAAQVNTFLFGGTWEADDIIRIQVGNKIKNITAGSTTTNTVVSNVEAAIDALDADVYPEFVSDESGATASSATATLTITANEAGVPFTFTLTPLEANGGAADAQTIEGAGSATTGTTATTNAGPNVWSTAANWDTGAAPTTGDTFHIDNNSDDILYGLSNAGSTITAGHIWQSFTGTIGLPKTNELGTEYPEYRTEYLTIDCTTLHVGRGEGTGSGRIKVNSGTVQTAVVVFNTGSSIDDLPAFLWKGTHASNTFTAMGDASVGVAVFGGETAVIATLNVDGGAEVLCGLGVTLTTINVTGGNLIVNSAIAGTVTVLGGTVTIQGTATVAQLNIRGGTVNYDSTGTLSGNTTIGGDGVLNFNNGAGAVAVSNAIDLYGRECRIIDTEKRVASLVVDFNEGASDGQVEWGTNVRLTRGTPA
jgi:hypothetical protein